MLQILVCGPQFEQQDSGHEFDPCVGSLRVLPEIFHVGKAEIQTNFSDTKTHALPLYHLAFQIFCET